MADPDTTTPAEPQEPKVPELFIPTQELDEDVNILRDLYFGTLGTERERAMLRRLVTRYRKTRSTLIINKLRVKLINGWGDIIAPYI